MNGVTNFVHIYSTTGLNFFMAAEIVGIFFFEANSRIYGAQGFLVVVSHDGKTYSVVNVSTMSIVAVKQVQDERRIRDAWFLRGGMAAFSNRIISQGIYEQHHEHSPKLSCLHFLDLPSKADFESLEMIAGIAVTYST